MTRPYDIFMSLVGGGGRCGTNWPTEVVEIASLREFDENYRFFTASFDQYMGPSFRLFYTFHPKKDPNDGFCKKMTEVIIKLDKMLSD
jgi:hypothetical protein